MWIPLAFALFAIPGRKYPRAGGKGGGWRMKDGWAGETGTNGGMRARAAV